MTTFGERREAFGSAGTFGAVGAPFYDVLIAAQPSARDTQMRNAVHAARKDGETQTVISESSQVRHGVYDYKRTDLALETDTQSAQWAEAVLLLYAYPQITLKNVSMLPGIAETSWDLWRSALELDLVSDLVRIRWAPPDRPENVIDLRSRVVGFKHMITRSSWELSWELVGADPLGLSGAVFTLGHHTNDRLDAGYVIGFG
jgi:hypothetical protein